MSLTTPFRSSANRATISRVEFFQGATKIGEALAAPYSIVWNNVPQSSYTLTARATDSIGGTALSAPVQIKIGAYTE